MDSVGNEVFPEKREECGLFGIFGDPDAVQKTYFGLHALQHRGQESAGIASSNGEEIHCYKGMGTVMRVFRNGSETLDKLRNPIAIGHVRYSTTGSSVLSNAQPFLVHHADEYYALAHNGNLINALELRAELEERGSIFQSTMDSEVIVHLIARQKGPVERAIAAARRGALTPEAAEEAYLEIFTRWFGVSPKGTWFWMRTKSLYDPRCHFYELTYLLGRMVSLEMLQRIRTNGKMSREEYCKAVEDTVSADFAGYRLKQGRGSPMRQADWKELLEPVRGISRRETGTLMTK